MQLTAKPAPRQSKLAHRAECETLFHLPRLGLRIDGPSTTETTAPPVKSDGSRQTAVHRVADRSIAEVRLEKLVQRDRSTVTGVAAEPKVIPETNQIAQLLRHAENLIDRLTEWSSELDRREAEIAQRERTIECQLRSLRQRSCRAIG